MPGDEQREESLRRRDPIDGVDTTTSADDDPPAGARTATTGDGDVQQRGATGATTNEGTVGDAALGATTRGRGRGPRLREAGADDETPLDVHEPLAGESGNLPRESPPSEIRGEEGEMSDVTQTRALDEGELSPSGGEIDGDEGMSPSLLDTPQDEGELPTPGGELSTPGGGIDSDEGISPSLLGRTGGGAGGPARGPPVQDAKGDLDPPGQGASNAGGDSLPSDEGQALRIERGPTANADTAGVATPPREAIVQRARVATPMQGDHFDPRRGGEIATSSPSQHSQPSDVTGIGTPTTAVLRLHEQLHEQEHRMPGVQQSVEDMFMRQLSPAVRSSVQDAMEQIETFGQRTADSHKDILAKSADKYKKQVNALEGLTKEYEGRVGTAKAELAGKVSTVKAELDASLESMFADFSAKSRKRAEATYDEELQRMEEFVAKKKEDHAKSLRAATEAREALERATTEARTIREEVDESVRKARTATSEAVSAQTSLEEAATTAKEAERAADKAAERLERATSNADATTQMAGRLLGQLDTLSG